MENARSRSDLPAGLLILVFAFVIFVGCRQPQEYSSGSSATAPAVRVTPKPAAVVAPEHGIIRAAELDTLRTLVSASMTATQQDVFGQLLAKNLESDVSTDKTTAVVNLMGASSLLLSCDRGDDLEANGTVVPYKTTIIVEFTAFEVANLSPKVFSQIDGTSALELELSANVADKYGHPERREFLDAIVTREEASKMDWNWFRGAIFHGTFDPSAFSKFDLISGQPPSPQPVNDVLQVMRESAEKGKEAYGLPDPKDEVFNGAMKMANWMDCLVH